MARWHAGATVRTGPRLAAALASEILLLLLLVLVLVIELWPSLGKCIAVQNRSERDHDGNVQL